MKELNEARQPTAEEVAAAVKDAGFLLEQEVASLFEREGYRVWTNHPYRDQEEGTEREVDVIAEKTIEVGARHIRVSVICQCKNNSYSLAAISRGKDDSDKTRAPEEYYFPASKRTHKLQERSSPTFLRVGLNRSHYSFNNSKKAVMLCRILMDKKRFKAVNMDGDLIIASIKPYLAERENYLSWEILRDMKGAEVMLQPNADSIWLFFPMLVVAGPLFVLNATSSQATCKVAQHFTITRKLKTGYYEGTCLVEVVQWKHLSRFLRRKMSPFIQSVVTNSERLL